MDGTVNWAKREDTRGLTGGTTADGATLGAGIDAGDAGEAKAGGVFFRGVAGLIDTLAEALTTGLTVGLVLDGIVGLTGGASDLAAFGVGFFSTVAFFATVCDLGTGLVLTAVLTGALTVGLAFTAGLLLTATFTTGFAAGLAFTTGLATDFTTALPAAGLATGLTTALLTGLVLALVLAATVLALVDTASFLF